MNRLFLKIICSMTIGGCLGLVTASYASIENHTNEDVGCKFTGCYICEPNGCTLGPGEWLGDILSQGWVLRCVEYDGIPPAHCANVYRTEYDVLPDHGTCYMTDCANGTATSTVCDNPWIRETGG